MTSTASAPTDVGQRRALNRVLAVGVADALLPVVGNLVLRRRLP